MGVRGLRMGIYTLVRIRHNEDMVFAGGCGRGLRRNLICLNRSDERRAFEVILALNLNLNLRFLSVHLPH